MVHSGSVTGGARMKSKSQIVVPVPQETKPVEKFLMSLIKEVATSSPCPGSPPSPPNTSLSHNSQEVIEEALGSLANLIISTAATNSSGAPNYNPLTTETTTISIKNAKSRKGKKNKDHNNHRQNLLLRQQSSLKALTPEDLGRIIDSATYATTTTSQTFVNNNNASTNTETSTVTTISHTDHLSTFHLRKPISSYRQAEIIGGGGRHPSSDNDHNTAKVVTRDQRSKSSCATEGETNQDNSSNTGYYYPAANNRGRKGLSKSQSRLQMDEDPPHQPSKDNKRCVISSSSPPPTQNLRLGRSDERPDDGPPNDDVDDDDANFRSHGHMCIHHYHHHYHHHYYHQPKAQEGTAYQTAAEQTNLQHDAVDKVGKKCSGQHLAQFPSPPPPGRPRALASQPLEHLQDISFYRKFSATSPITRSKSSLAWPGNGNTTTELNVLSLWTKSKKQKSRSTPIKLDMISEPISLPPISLMHYSRSSMCGGCVYCSKNELSCNCCCDECCCARQFSQVIENKVDDDGADVENESPNGSSNMMWKSSREAAGGQKFSSKNRSQSMDSFMHNEKYVVDDGEEEEDDYGIEIDDEILKYPNPFMDTHLLRHLEASDSEQDMEGDMEDEKLDSRQEIHSSTNSINKNIHSSSDNGGKWKDDLSKSKSYLSTNKLLSPDENTEDDDKLNRNKNGTGGAAEPSHQVSNSTNIIFTRKPSNELSPNKSGQRRRRSTLRIANGGIRQSPAISAKRPVTTTISSGNHHTARTPNGDDNNSRLLDTRRGPTSAVMTVTVDTMSLFLDAVHQVHVQMNKE